MRVGLVAPPWFPIPPPAYGGIESVVDTLARGLVAAGHDVLLAASSDSTCPVPKVDGFGRSNPTVLGASLSEARHVVAAYTAMTDVDIVHDHTVIGPLHGNRPAGVPVVATVHGPFVPEMVDVYTAAGRNTSIIAISHHHASTAGSVPITAVIHHGLRVEEVTPGDGKGGYACFLGRVHPSKGIREAIDICRDAGMPLKIAAKMRERDEHDYFDQEVRPRLGRDCEFLGELGTKDKHDFLGGAIALINPIQWNEPFGMVMIESLASGTPVVATPRGSAPEIVDDGVTGFIRSHHAQLVEALGQAATLDRAQCRLAAEQRFSAERMTADHVRLYERLVGH